MFDTLAQHLDFTELLIFALTCVGAAATFLYRNVLSGWVRATVEVFSGLRKVPELEARVKLIQQYVSPNGGKSIIDTINRVEGAVSRLESDLTLLSDTVRAQNDTDELVGRFHAAPEGDNIYVNQAYAHMLRVGKVDLMGWRFLNFVHPEDVAKVRQHWELCRAERRPYRMSHRMLTSEREVIDVHVTASPIPEDGAPRMWVGTIRQDPITVYGASV